MRHVARRERDCPSQDFQPSAGNAVLLKNMLRVHPSLKLGRTGACIRQLADNTQQYALSGCRTSPISRWSNIRIYFRTGSRAEGGVLLKVLAFPLLCLKHSRWACDKHQSRRIGFRSRATKSGGHSDVRNLWVLSGLVLLMSCKGMTACGSSRCSQLCSTWSLLRQSGN